MYVRENAHFRKMHVKKRQKENLKIKQIKREAQNLIQDIIDIELIRKTLSKIIQLFLQNVLVILLTHLSDSKIR